MTSSIVETSGAHGSGTGSSTRLKIAVVVPTYNEIENLPVLVDRVTALGLDSLGFVIVDDGSPDGTGELADRMAAAYPGVFKVMHRPGKQGLGRAYVAGFKTALEAGAELVVQMDADLSHPPDELPKMLERITGADVVVGTRYRAGGGVDSRWSILRKSISRGGNFGIRLILGLKVSDATSGFKMFRRHSLERIGLDRLRLTGFGFQAEVAYRCQQAGLKVVEHPYLFLDRSAGKSKMSFSIMVEAFVRLTRLRLFG